MPGYTLSVNGVAHDLDTDAAKPLSLRPTSASLMLDADYLLYAVGLLAAVAPEAALKLGLDNLNPLDMKEAKDGCSSAA